MASLTLPTKACAIWPFDIFTKNNQTGNQSKFPTLIQRIIDKFKLNSGEVQKVVNEVEDERRQKMQAFRESRLEEAVKAGVITAEQKQVLLNKEAEMEEKQKQLSNEIRQWMDNSGIDFQKLAPYKIGFGGPGFGGRGFGKGHWLGGF